MLGDAILDLYHLRGEGDQLNDEPIDQSEALPGIDLALLRRFIVLDNHVEAVRTWQQRIQSPTPLS